MRVARLVLVGAALAASSWVAPATAASPVALTHASPLRVTGAVQPFTAYLRRGLSPERAARLMELDHLARSGVSTHLLNGALGAGEASGEASAPAPQVFSSLDPAGDLDGKGADDVVENRWTTSGSSTSLSIVARDGGTGRVLWSRTEQVHDAFVFAVGTPVAGRPGVLLFTVPFNKPQTLTGIDGRGRTLWRRTMDRSASAPQPPPAVGVITYDGGLHYTFTTLDAPIRRGAREILVVEGDVKFASGDAGGGTTGAVAFSAIDERTGAVRRLPGAASSSSGLALGATADDLDGDGLVDAVVAVGGSTRSVTSVRLTDGRTIWSAPFTGDLAGLAAIRSVLGERAKRALADDVVVQTVPSSRVAGLPLPSSGIAQALLLGGHTGRVAWSKRADGLYVVERVGRPALGTWVDRSSTTGAQDVAQADVTVYDAAGRSLWAHSYRRTAPKHDTSDQAFVLVGAIGDLDMDGGNEGIAVFIFFNADGGEGSSSFFRSKDGKAVPEPESRPLGAHIRPGVEDLVQVQASRTGLRVTVLDSRHRVVWSRTVPGSKGMSSGYAFASAVTRHSCADVLVAGSGRSATLSAVLASNGQVRWAVTRTGASLGRVQRPATPRVSC